MKKFVYWFPRVLSVLFIGFISMFALDVFDEPRWWLALMIHLIPSYILVIITVIAWKRERLGGWLFLLAGAVLLIFTHFEAWVLVIPAWVIGGLFLRLKKA